MRFVDLMEGPNDPGLFKAIFMAGGPGSGKSYIASMLGLQSRGLKIVNSDIAFEYLMRKRNLRFDMPPEEQEERDAARNRAKGLTKKQQNIYLDGRLGVVIDGTAKDVTKMTKLKRELEAIGYQTLMVFVNTSLETALQRNQMRPRKLPSEILIKAHQQVQENKDELAKVFSENFIEIKTPLTLDAAPALKKVDRFINSPIRSALARDWLSAAHLQKTMTAEEGTYNLDAAAPMQGKPKVYVDLDGVLANFYAGITAHTGHAEPRELAFQDMEDTMASLKGTDFFYNLPKYEQADELIELINSATKGDWYILSSPLKYDREGSAVHKARWVKDNLNIQPRGMHFTGNKAEFAKQPDGTSNILIDDYPKYLEKWTGEGGIGVKYKGHVGNIDDVKATLDQYFAGNVEETIRKVKGGYRLLSKNGENLGTYASKSGAEQRERQVQYFKHMNEAITPSALAEIERYADMLFRTLGIDVSFTRHFIDRVNDKRNLKPISATELIRLFREEYRNWGKTIAQLGPDAEAVLKDMQTNINVPFVLKWDPKNKELDLVAKTVMRKPDFKTSDPVFAVEQEVNENFADGKVKGKSRPGRVKRAGASCAGSVTDLRAKAKKYSGERGKMYHWCANMKSGRDEKK